MFVGAVEHTCYDAVSCFVKCVCWNWWQSSQNVTSFPAAHFYWCAFRCFSVCLNCMETVLRFKVYELRTLYQVKVLILYTRVYIYIYIYIYIHTYIYTPRLRNQMYTEDIRYPGCIGIERPQRDRMLQHKCNALYTWPAIGMDRWL